MNKESQGSRRGRAGSRSADTQVSTGNTSGSYKETEGVERDPLGLLGMQQWCRRPWGGSPALGRARMQAWSSGQMWRGMCNGRSRTTPRDEWATAPRTFSITTSSPSRPQGAPRLQPPQVLGPGEEARAAAPVLQRE